jgi:hypothetical protein
MPYLYHDDDDNYEQEPNAVSNVAGVCKDCGNGTLNNNLAEAFDYNGFGYYCLNCGSTHVDLVEAY